MQDSLSSIKEEVSIKYALLETKKSEEACVFKPIFFIVIPPRNVNFTNQSISIPGIMYAKYTTQSFHFGFVKNALIWPKDAI